MGAMKTMKLNILISASLLAFLTGCVSKDVYTFEADETEIRFSSPVVNTLTKGDGWYGEMGDTYKTEENFSVWAVYHPTTFKGWTNNSITYINRAECAFDENYDDASTGEGGWSTFKVSGKYYYWPKSGVLTFAAYSPSKAHNPTPVLGDGTGKIEYGADGLTIENFSVNSDITKQQDLMYSKRSYNRTYSNVGDNDEYDGVDLEFQHALSSIKFKVQKKAAYTGYTITLKSISLEDINYKGSFAENIQNETTDEYDSKPKWTPTDEFDESDGLDDLTNYMIYNSSLVITEAATDTDDVKYHTISQGAILLPQTFGESDTALIRVNYTIQPTSMPEISQTATIPLNKLSEGWVIGKRYTYNISIGYDTITISPTVIGWENVNGDVAVN